MAVIAMRGVLVLALFLFLFLSPLAFAMCEWTCEAFAENKGIKSTAIGEDGKPAGFVDTTTYGCRISWSAPCCTKEELKDKCKVLRINPTDAALEFTRDYEKESDNDCWWRMKVGAYRTVWCEKPDDFQNPTGGFHISETFRYKDPHYLKAAWDAAKKKLDECAVETGGCEDEKKAVDDAKIALDKSEADLKVKQKWLADDKALLEKQVNKRDALEEDYNEKIGAVNVAKAQRDEAQMALDAANSFKDKCVIGELATVGLFGFGGELIGIAGHLLGLGVTHLLGCGEADAIIDAARDKLEIMESALSGDETFLKIWENDNLATLLQLRAEVTVLEGAVAKEETDVEDAQHDVDDKDRAYDAAEKKYELCLEEKCKDLLDAEKKAHEAYQACLDAK